jgi:hypothetical protein
MSTGYDAVIDLLESIGQFLGHLNIYTKAPSTPAMDNIVVKIIVELLATLALATKELKQGRPSESIAMTSHLTQCNAVKFVMKLLGEKEVEAVLQRLSRLKRDEARMTAFQILEVIHRLVQNMRVVMCGG